MTESLVVQVLQLDISESARRREANQADISSPFPRPCHCPIALALQRQTKRYWGVSATRAWRSHCDSFDLPNEAQQFVVDADTGKSVSPITFTITRKV